MAVRFKNGKIRLWKSGDEAKAVGIGINFGKNGSKKERDQIYETIRSILNLKYGEEFELK